MGVQLLQIGDESNEIAMSKYQAIQPNRIFVRFNIKIWQFMKKKIKSTEVWNVYIYFEKREIKYILRRKIKNFIIIILLCIFINYVNKERK